KPRSGISIVWIIPIVAALIGAWVAYKSFSEVGPTIIITFENAEGLVAGKTKVKYKDVEVGMVEAIDLESDLKHVRVTVQMN
ncbi:MAG TPA: MCE family protein, partial [Gammaproteobacteria bacterium]|nr:MCE family protein [Gammaproteobacteria bacterium]